MAKGEETRAKRNWERISRADAVMGGKEAYAHPIQHKLCWNLRNWTQIPSEASVRLRQVQDRANVNVFSFKWNMSGSGLEN